MRSLYIVLLAGMALLADTGASSAQQNVNIRGTIGGLEGTQLSIKTRDGTAVTVEVPEAIEVRSTKPFSLADIKPGMALGVTTVKRADGAIVAIDVRPISATANLGLSPYDLQPQSTMTNATIEGGVSQVANGNEITLNYKSGTVKVLVVKETAMSQAAPGNRSDLKAGETVYVAARKGEGGKLTAVRVQVSKDGVKPTQ